MFFERHPDGTTPEALKNYFQTLERSHQEEELLRRLRWDLEALYRSTIPSEMKVARKREIFATARKAFAELRGKPVDLPPSNAYVLASLAYNELLPALARFQQKNLGDSALFDDIAKAMRKIYARAGR